MSAFRGEAHPVRDIRRGPVLAVAVEARLRRDVVPPFLGALQEGIGVDLQRELAVRLVHALHGQAARVIPFHLRRKIEGEVHHAPLQGGEGVPQGSEGIPRDLVFEDLHLDLHGLVFVEQTPGHLCRVELAVGSGDVEICGLRLRDRVVDLRDGDSVQGAETALQRPARGIIHRQRPCFRRVQANNELVNYIHSFLLVSPARIMPSP